MPRYQITTLSPIHISSGKLYENNFNLLYNKGYIYIYDEFKIAQFFIDKNIEIPLVFDALKENIKRFKKEIIASNLHIRKIESEFSKIDKNLLENISTSSEPIIPGSSIKGSLRTAILDSMANETAQWDSAISNFKNKNFDARRFEKKIDVDLANFFKDLKVSDSLNQLKTKVYKTINIKKKKEYQKYRKEKVMSLINLVECIKPNQKFDITIDDRSEKRYFNKIGSICNKFYIPWYRDELKNYFKAPTKADKNTFEKLKRLNNHCFLINVGRFSGAERKSLNNLRYIKNSKVESKSESSTRTYALEKEPKDEIFYEKELLPFGWLLCELIE